MRTFNWVEDKLLGRGIPEGLNVESPAQYGTATYPKVCHYPVDFFGDSLMLNHEFVVFHNCQM